VVCQGRSTRTLHHPDAQGRRPVRSRCSGEVLPPWGIERLLVTSQTWKGGDYERATANLRLAVSEADRFTDRDQILDHVDALLRPVLPFDDLLDGGYDRQSAGAEDIARALMRLKLDLSAFLEAATFSDVWDLPIIAPSAREHTGYPTQKPLRLLERIVEAASARISSRS